MSVLFIAQLLLHGIFIDRGRAVSRVMRHHEWRILGVVYLVSITQLPSTQLPL